MKPAPYSPFQIRPQAALILALVVFAAFAWNLPAHAQTPPPANPVYIYLFWGDGCPHCARAKPFFERLAVKYPQVVLKSYEVYNNVENQQLFDAMAQKYGLEMLAVPTYFIGDNFLQGYSEELDGDIETVVQLCLESGCADPGAEFGEAAVFTTQQAISTQTSVPVTTITPTYEAVIQGPPVPAAEQTEALQDPPSQDTAPQDTAPQNTAPHNAAGVLQHRSILQVPFLGRIDLETQSAGLSTALIAFVDGFNPCSLWVLSMLLALTLHTGSRKKVLVIGAVFLFVTTAVYALFIVGLFSVLKFASFMGWVQVLVALVALFFALVNVKDYFWYKEGISFTIADSEKPGIFQRMRRLMDASQSMWGLIGATIVFAAGVSLVEFSCTAGFPVLWTNLLVSQNVTFFTFVLLLLLYLAIYQFDEMIIFLTAVYSLKASRLEEKHGRILKLIGGMLMLTLAGVMLINPAWMNTLSSSLLIFAIALLATLIVLLLHRVVLPFFGIRIGSEFRTE